MGARGCCRWSARAGTGTAHRGRTRQLDRPFERNRRGPVQGTGRGQRATTLRTIGAVLLGATSGNVIYSDLRVVCTGADGGRRAIFQGTAARRLPTTNCARLVTAADARSALTSVRRSSVELHQPGRCEPYPARAHCGASFVPHARHAVLFCLNTCYVCMSHARILPCGVLLMLNTLVCMEWNPRACLFLLHRTVSLSPLSYAARYTSSFSQARRLARVYDSEYTLLPPLRETAEFTTTELQRSSLL